MSLSWRRFIWRSWKIVLEDWELFWSSLRSLKTFECHCVLLCTTLLRRRVTELSNLCALAQVRAVKELLRRFLCFHILTLISCLVCMSTTALSRRPVRVVYLRWPVWKQCKSCRGGSTPARRPTLRRTLPEVVANDVELLGSCSMIFRRSLLPKESAWVDACRRVWALLAVGLHPPVFWKIHESLPSVCHFHSCLRLDCACPSFAFLCAVVELCACWQSPHSVCFGVVTRCLVWERRASWCVVLRSVGWSACTTGASWLGPLGVTLLLMLCMLVCCPGGGPGHLIRVDDSLDLIVVGEPGAQQHIVKDAWRAWCLQRHMSSSRRVADLDCFDEHVGGYQEVCLIGPWGSGDQHWCLLFARGAWGSCWFMVWLRLAFGLVVRNMPRLIISLGPARVTPVRPSLGAWRALIVSFWVGCIEPSGWHGGCSILAGACAKDGLVACSFNWLAIIVACPPGIVERRAVASAPLSGWPVLFVWFFPCLGSVEVSGFCWAFWNKKQIMCSSWSSYLDSWDARKLGRNLYYDSADF